jgi:sigma-B regulation protein RsbU (phosphoserine phosphatase)
MRATFMPKVSIRWIMPAVVMAPVVVVAIVLTWIAYETAQRTVSDLAGQNMRQIHGRIESHLSHLLDLPPAINQLNRSRLRDGVLSLGDPTLNSKPVYETLATFPDVSSVVLAGAAGQVMWVIRYPGETTYEYAIKSKPDASMDEYTMGADGRVPAGPPIHSYNYDPLGRPWYRAAIEADGATWGSVYGWIRGGTPQTLGISYVEPFRDDAGRLLGVINCELTLADISAFLRRLEIGKTGAAFIIERNGDLVATSRGLSCMKDGTGRLPAKEAADSRIAAAAGQLDRLFGSLDSIKTMRRADVTLDGEPTQMVVSAFRNRRNLDWLIVTLVPDSDFLADVRRSRGQSLFLGALAVLAALGLGLGMARWLVSPILAVVDHAQRVGGGDLEARIACTDNREMAQLSAALNAMADGLTDRVRLRHALNLAMEVQQNLLPSQKPKVRGVDMAARSQYCDETGGDYYDYLDVEEMGKGSLFLALGDVMGHGIAAAMLMATARGVLRSHVQQRGSLGDLLTHVNRLLVADTGGSRFMTMFLGVVDVTTMSLRWASAGHDQPLVYDPAAGTSTGIEGEGGMPLGVVDSESYEEQVHTGLRVGQVMLVGTDGLWESRNAAGELFGKERVIEAMAALAHLSAAEIEEGIYRRQQEFCGGLLCDDLTYVVIKLVGGS